MLAELLLNNSITRQRDTLSVDFAVSALVDHLTDGLEVGLAMKL